MTFAFQRIVHGGGTILAIADREIVGMTFEEGELSVTIRSDFYGREECDEEAALDLARKATSVNAMGKRIVSLLAEHGLIDRTMVLRIGELHHAQRFVLR